jgi:limonene-1,2-epoxide hydrolase
MTDAAILERLQFLEDKQEICELKAQYCAGCDDDHNPDTIEALFIEDGVWDSPGLATCHGHAQIREFMTGMGSSGRIRNSAHMVMNPQIKVDGDTATGHWRFMMMYAANAPDGFIQYFRIIGNYEDEFVKRDGRWLFKSLRPLVEENDPYPTEKSRLEG